MERYRWWHGVAFYAGVQVARLTLRLAAKRLVDEPSETREQDREFYRRERLPVFAPPPPAFPIAWGINNLSTIAGGLRVMNMPPSKERTDFLWWQGVTWLLFAAFDPAYFVLKSPINAAVITILYSATTLMSLKAASRLNDPTIPASLITTLLWLGLANPVGITQALWNRDPFWQVGPAMIPSDRWLK